MANNSNSLLININGNAKDFLEELEKSKKKTEDLDKVLTSTAKTSAAAFAAFAATIAVTTKAFADYETALVGVGKTTNIEGKNLENFGKKFQKLSSQIPLTTNELLGIAQAAGQLGVEGEENLLVFTETIAKLGVATDLSGEQAATALTRILNVTNESISTIGTFGSVIVALGNNFAATESEIVKVTNEVARSTAVFNVSSTEAAALATALKSVGVQAELGGSVLGKSFRTIDDIIRSGGKELENLAVLTGMTGDQLRQTFQEDATSVFQSFVEGLGRINEEGGSVSATLEQFGLKGDEVNKILPTLAKNSKLLGEALNLANKEAKNATALNEEAEKAFDTLNSEFVIFQNNITNAATTLGAKFAPEISALLKDVNEVISSFKDLDDETVSTIASFIKWGAIISGVVAGISSLALILGKAYALLTVVGGFIGGALVTGLGTAAGAAAVFWTALTGPIGLTVAAIAGVVAGVFALKEALKPSEVKDTALTEINKQLDELIKKRQDLNRIDPNNVMPETRQNIAAYDAEIKKLEELRRKKIESANTPLDLTRPTDGFGEIEAPTLAGLDEQIIPLRPETQGDDESTEKLKKSLDKKTELIDAATQKRIDTAKAENIQLKQLQEARNAGATEQELAFLARRQEIEAEFAEARQIKNEEERALALENLRLKNEEELNEINEFEARKEEERLIRQEQQKALDEELNNLTKEQRALLNEEELNDLRNQVLTKEQIKKQEAKDDLKRQIEDRNQFLKDEEKFGKTYATLQQFFRSEEVQGFADTSSQLEQLSKSRNSTLKAIGKAAARTNAAIATYEGAIKAYSSLAGIPIVGPALGFAAAAALTAFGVEQQAQISAAQGGGFVPNTSGGTRDRVPMMLEPEELVVPKALSPNFIQAVGNPNSGNFANDDPTNPNTGEKVLRLEGPLVENQNFISELATELRNQIEFDNVRI